MYQTADSPKYEVNVEGQIHPWSKGEISVAEIRQVGNLPEDRAVVGVDLSDNHERELPEGEVHQIVPREPGKPLVKRMSFKRADT